MKHEELTSKVIGICMKVHSILGPGLLEAIYEEAVCIELVKAGMQFSRQQGVHVIYEEQDIGRGYRYDILIENKVLLEVKSCESVAPVHLKTALTYMRFTGIEIGLLINFNVAHLREGISRLIQDRPVSFGNKTISPE